MTAVLPRSVFPDADLLAEFRATRDGDAFAELVTRYSPLVWSVCRRVLADRHLAEDAYQQTFAKLARKASSLDATRPLAGWLFAVARNTAIKLVPEATSRLSDVPSPVGDDPLSVLSARELLVVLDAELGRLSEADRSVLLLCGVENLSRDEAAARLGWSSIRVKKRLETARGKLRTRLETKGLTLTVLAALTVTAGDAPAAAVVAKASAAWAVPAASLGLVRRGMLVGLAALAVAVSAPAPSAPPAPPKVETPVRTDRHGDPLPADALLRLGTTRFRHGFMVTGIAYHPDGKTVALSGPGQDFLGLYASDSGRLVRKIGKKTWESRSLAFRPDGKLLVYSGYREGAIVADVVTGDVVTTLPGWSYTVAWSADGKRIISGGDKTVRVFDAATWQELHVLTAGEQQIGTVAFLSGNRAVVGFENGDVAVYAPTGNKLRTISSGGEGGTVTAAPVGNRLAVGTRDKGYAVFDADTGAKLSELALAPGYSRYAVFSPDGSEVWVGGKDGTAAAFDAATGKKRLGIRVGPFAAYHIGLSPDGKTLGTATAWQSGLRQWDTANGKELLPTVGPAHRGGIDGVQLAPDGRSAFTWGRDQTVWKWNLADGTATKLFDDFGEGRMFGSMAVSPDGRWVLAGSHVSKTISLWATATGKKVRDVRTFDGAGNNAAINVYPMAFTPDSKSFAYGGPDGTVRVCDVERAKEVAKFAENSLGRPITHVKFRDGGKELHITLGTKANVQVGAAARWRWKETAPVTWVSFNHPVWMSEFSPDGSRVVAAAEWQSAPTVWDAATGKKLYTLTEHPKGCYAAAFSPCGRLLATGGADHDDVIRVRDAATGQQFHEFRGQHSSIMALAFTPDSRRLITGAGDSTGIVWDLTGSTAGRQPKSFAEAWRKLGQHGGPDVLPAVFQLAGSPDGLKFLHEKLPPATAPAANVVEDLVAKLDAPAFAVRTKADSDLAKLGAGALPRLKAARDGTKSAEVREKLVKLIAGLETGAEAVTARRAVWVAELAKSHELLTAWAGGDADAVLTKEAKAALARGR